MSCLPAPRLALTHPSWPSALERLPSAALLCAAALLFGVILASTQALERTGSGFSGVAGGEIQASKSSLASPQRLGEGTEIVDQAGCFRTEGDRIAFFAADGQKRYLALENRNLERIARAMAGSPDPLSWTVSGVLTEYRGANYLLVRRAIVKGPAEEQNSKN